MWHVGPGALCVSLVLRGGGEGSKPYCTVPCVCVLLRRKGRTKAELVRLGVGTALDARQPAALSRANNSLPRLRHGKWVFGWLRSGGRVGWGGVGPRLICQQLIPAGSSSAEPMRCTAP